MDEKLDYLLIHMDNFIEQEIYAILNDSETDPHYSAVTANNLIICYLEVTHELGWNQKIISVEDYFRGKCFSDNEIALFDERKRKEAKYFIGTQY